MINKFRYKKPAKENLVSDANSVNSNSSEGGGTLKTNKSKKTIMKVIDNDLDAITRICDTMTKKNDCKEDNHHGVLDDKMKKELHVRIFDYKHRIWSRLIDLNFFFNKTSFL